MTDFHASLDAALARQQTTPDDLTYLPICGPCVRGEGSECHTPGCALWLRDVPPDGLIAEFALAWWPALATRETVARVLETHTYVVDGPPGPSGVRCPCGMRQATHSPEAADRWGRTHLTDALLDALTTPAQWAAGLAEDWPLVDRVARGMTGWDFEQVGLEDVLAWRQTAHDGLRALAAVLAEREGQ